MVIAGTTWPVPVAAPAREEGVVPWIALVESAVPKVSPHPVNVLVSCSSVRWGVGEVTHPLLPCLFHSRFSVPLRSILGGGVGDKE